MPVQTSVGVNVSEIDLTTIVPTVSTTIGAIAGVFNWGPVNEPILIDSETSLVSRFGAPKNNNAETWFTAASFLGYGNKLYVVRAANTTSANTNGSLTAYANTNTVTGIVSIKNRDDFNTRASSLDADILYAAKYPGSIGNSLKISVCDTAAGYSATANLSTNTVTGAATIAVGANTATFVFTPVGNTAVSVANTQAATSIGLLSVGDYVQFGNSSIGTINLKIASIDTIPTTNSTAAYFNVTFKDNYRLRADSTVSSITRKWEYYALTGVAPGTSNYVKNFGNTAAKDELHVVVVDEDGKFSGVPGTVLEVYRGLSRATDAKLDNNQSNYYKDVINQNSKYIWNLNDRSGAASATAALITTATAPTGSNLVYSFVNGQDGLDETGTELATIYTAYEYLKDPETIDISLVLTGKSVGGIYGEQIGNFLVDNIAETRKDCVVFTSLPYAAVVNNVGFEMESAIAFRNLYRDTSYAVLDSGYKQIYDRYNDVYRYVPLNGDIAGLCVRTDNLRDAWWSPAGFNRGQIKNIIKLAWNPKKAERDITYPLGINPVVSFPGQGTVLYGDRTAQAKPSAFDRINVRRLFIVLEKAISRASKYTLFEFNDAFTRFQFVSLVEPYLRDIQARRGIFDFKVVCDTTNNTPEIIDRNEFVGDIYIKPARSINFIQLNFVAVKTGVNFNTIIGKF